MDGLAEELAVPDKPWTREAQDEAFVMLANRHARFLYRVAFGLLRTPQNAEDAVQETLLKLYRTGGWREMEDERAFLARSVWRVGLSRLAGAGTQVMRHAEDVTEIEIEAGGPNPEQTALGQAERVLIRRMIDALPDDLRQPLVLSAIEEMRSQEIAVILGIPEGTVRTRIMRAKAELRRRFLAARPKERQPTQAREARR